MLLLTFRAAENLYAIDTARVVEVVPRINLRLLPHAPDFLAGVFDYRSTVVPAVDLGLLLGSEGCRDRLSTRIILVDSHPAVPSRTEQPGEANSAATAAVANRQDPMVTSGSEQEAPPCGPRRWLLGLIAEQVSDVVSVKPEQVISSSIQLPRTPYLGAIVEIDHEMVQLIAVHRVLEDSLRRSFFENALDDDRESVSAGKVQAGSI